MAMGIYKIINVINNKFYVGSAVNFSKRKSRHFSELRTNKHNNKHLQAAWDKYGESAFVFVIVEEITDKSALHDRENVWLSKHVGQQYCYNIGVTANAPMLGMSGKLSPTWGRKRTAAELVAQNWTGRKHHNQSKIKISESLKGHAVTTETRIKISQTLQGEGNYWYGKKRPDHSAKVSKSVIAINPQGQSTEYVSIQQLREQLNLKPSTVNRAVKSQKQLVRGPYTGWRFLYKTTS